MKNYYYKNAFSLHIPSRLVFGLGMSPSQSSEAPKNYTEILKKQAIELKRILSVFKYNDQSVAIKYKNAEYLLYVENNKIVFGRYFGSKPYVSPAEPAPVRSEYYEFNEKTGEYIRTVSQVKSWDPLKYRPKRSYIHPKLNSLKDISKLFGFLLPLAKVAARKKLKKLQNKPKKDDSLDVEDDY